MFKKYIVVLSLFLVFLIMNSIVVVSYVEFKEKVKAQQQREQDFFGSDGLVRISKLAGYLTFGGGVPIEERSLFGRTCQAFMRDIAASPIVAGGTFAASVEKVKLTIEGIALTMFRPKKVMLGEPFSITRKINKSNLITRKINRPN